MTDADTAPPQNAKAQNEHGDATLQRRNTFARMSRSSKSSIMDRLDEEAVREDQDMMSRWNSVGVALRTSLVSLLDDETWVEVEPGYLVGSVQSCPEFSVDFQLKLNGIPSETSNIIQFTVGDDPKSQVPSINVVAGTTQLSATIAFAGFSRTVYGSFEGVSISRPVNVSFSFHAGVVMFEVGSETVQESWPDLGLPSWHDRLRIYACGKGRVAPEAEISNVEFHVLTLPTNVDADTHPVLELEPAEQELLDQTIVELERSRKWGAFDAFFGLILVGNVICIGIEMESSGDLSAFWSFVNGIFLIIFSIELCLRVMLMLTDVEHPGQKSKAVQRNHSNSEVGTIRSHSHKKKRLTIRQLCKVLCDPWLIFDAVIVFISGLEFILDAFIPLDPVNLRLFRFVRLAKMARVVRAFRELGMLLNGMLYITTTLLSAWALLGIITYIFAIMSVRLSWWALGDRPEAFDELNLAEFKTIPTAMLKLLQMATFDDWTRPVQTFFELDSTAGTLTAFSLVTCSCISGFGVMNVVVGIMCFTAFQLDAEIRRSAQAISVSEKRDLLIELQSRIKCYGGRPLFKSDRSIHSAELLEALTKDEINIDLVEGLELSGKDVVELIQAFEEDGQIEITGLIEAIGIIELQRHFGDNFFDLFGFNPGTKVRCNDMLFFFFCEKRLEETITSLEERLKNVCSLCYDVLSVVHERSFKAFTLLNHRHAPAKLAAGADKEARLVTLRDLVNIGYKSNAGHATSRLAMGLDVFAGVLIMLNCVFSGVNTVRKGVPTKAEMVSATIVDGVFTILFTIEFVLRAMLGANLAEITAQTKVELGDDSNGVLNQDAMNLMEDLQERMRLCGILPPCPAGGPMAVLRYFPVMLLDLQSAFDFFVVLICLLDSAIFEPLKYAGVFDGNMSMISMLRVFRLLRLTRFLRTIRIFPQLQMLVRSLFDTWRNIAAILFNVVLFLFGFSVFAVDKYNANTDATDDALKVLYGNVPTGMLTCWQLITFDGWGPLIQITVDRQVYVITASSLLLMGFLGLGILKMAIGVTCASAVVLSRGQYEEKRREQLVEYIQAMRVFGDIAKKELGSAIIPQEVFETVLGIKIRPRLSILKKRSSYDGESLGVNLTLEQAEQVISSAMQPRVAIRLLKVFRKAQLSPATVKQIVETVDYHRSGFVSVDQFVKGGLVLKEHLSKIDIFASTISVRLIRQKFVSTSRMIIQMHEKMELIVQEMNALVHRTKIRRPHKHSSDSGLAVIANLSPVAMQALLELEGSSEHMLKPKESQKYVRVLRGMGRITIHDDQVTGHGKTCFRHELKQGDSIIWESSTSPGTFFAAKVMSVPAMDRMVIREHFASSEFGNDPVPFAISRRKADRDTHDEYVSTEQQDMTMAPQMSPRSSQQFLEWEIQSRAAETRELHDLLSEHMVLNMEKKDLEKELHALANRKLAVCAFMGFKLLHEGKLAHDETALAQTAANSV
eukprot:TRINITY_DN29096_c0_g2_i1.p1 TRINITY_DN29096_c0_g2~~TRINITY_DN29096_c0_g2_i1.p1  ORF type:complete len:1467 (+),score=249.38 TRINITY_DN29096_c0_g2_i1:52-4452(+)